jgi:quercetin dioxygenase-like cupin family protein
MLFVQIYADAEGESHFREIDVPDAEQAFGPPPNPTGRLADFGATSNMFVFTIPAGTEVPAHPAPQAYISIILGGEVEIIASDGESRRFGPGGLLFCDDLTGKGHVTRALSESTGAFINRLSA